MTIFKEMLGQEHEQLVFCHDKETGLKAIIGIHNTQLGPALGGTRLWHYKDESEAIVDVLRLSRGMTYKNAAAGLNLGGGKAVIIASPDNKTPELMKKYGEFVNRLAGTYVTAADMNTNEQDMCSIRQTTQFVTGLPTEKNGSGSPSPFTALGVFEGIKASVFHRMNKSDLDGVTVSVQGLGAVGFSLCHLLHEAGAKLIVADISSDKVKQANSLFNAEAVGIDEIISASADVFAPCARGAIVNEKTLDSLNCKIIAGAANNQLEHEESHSHVLRQKGILYAPDYIINAGGVINISFEIGRAYDKGESLNKVKGIYKTLLDVYQLAEANDCSTWQAANQLAEKRLQENHCTTHN